MKMSVNVRGDEEIRRALRYLPAEVAGAPMREAAEAGGEVVKRAAVAHAEAIRKTGTLARSIAAEIVRDTAGSRVVVRVGPGPQGWYGRMVEYGHAIVRVVGRTRVGGRVRRQSVNLGQVPPKPWLRPAFDESKAAAAAVMEAVLRRRLAQWRP